MFVINRDQQEMEDAGFAKYAFVPFLIAADGTYPAEANRYLRTRANCEWEVLRASGISNFDAYAVSPGTSLLPDLFLD